jgi:hypothetical protein
VKPSLSITVEVGEGEDIEQVVDALNTVCQGHVEDQIDAALMGDGQPPKFYAGPRFKLLFHKQLRFFAVVPQFFDLSGLYDLGWNAGVPYGARRLGGVVPHHQPFSVLWPAVFKAIENAGGRWMAIDGTQVIDYSEFEGEFITEFERVLENVGAVQVVDIAKLHAKPGEVSAFVVALPASPLLAGWEVDDDQGDTWRCEPRPLFRSLAEAVQELGSMPWFASAEDLDVALMDGSWEDIEVVEAQEIAEGHAEIPF